MLHPEPDTSASTGFAARCVRHSAEVGAVVVATDPKDDKARAFYETHGFRWLDERRRFIPMSELIECEVSGWNV